MDGGVDQGPWLQDRVGRGVGATGDESLVGCSKEGASREGSTGGGKGSGGRGVSKFSGPSVRAKGRVGVKKKKKTSYFSKVGGLTSCVAGTEQISRRVSYFFVSTKKKKMTFFEGCPVGWGGGPTGAGLVDGGVDQRALVAGEGWEGGRRAGWQFEKKGESRGKSREGLACLAVPQEGARARGGIQGLQFRKGRSVIFRKLTS